MKHLFKPRVSGLLLTLLLFAGGTQTVFAVGTPSGTPITNEATVNYIVNTEVQTAIVSDDFTTGAGPTTFLVDNMVDLTVANLDGGTVAVLPGQNDRVLTFSVTNTGNTTQGYSLTVDIGVTAITMGVPEIWLDADLNGVYTAADDTLYTPGDNAGNLDPNSGVPGDDTMTVFIVADTPLTPVDGTVDNYSLLATTLDGATTTVTSADGDGDDPTLVEAVFADIAGTAALDAANDGEHSDVGSYTAGSASLTVTKQAVALDPFGTDYAIPGAIVTYTIVITNNGGSDADSVVITDDISAFTPADVSWVVDSIRLDGALQTDVLDGDSSTFVGNLVTVNVGTIAAGGGTTTITFQVTIIN